MRYTVKLFPQDDGGIVIHTPTDYLVLSRAEWSQLADLIDQWKWAKGE